MLNYKMPSGIPAGSRAVWSRQVLAPLSGDALLPLSFSIIAEVASRAWFRYYDGLGFDPMPSARIVRESEGRAYFNLTLSAQREMALAAIEPVTLVVDGTNFPVTKIEQAGFLAGIKAGFNERKLAKAQETLAQENHALVEKMFAWDDRVRDLRWTQADILMIMEEIEPDAVDAFAAFLAARQNLLLHVNRVLRLAQQPPGETLRQLDRGMGSIEGVIEAEIARRLAKLAAGTTPALRAWLEGVSLSDWQTQLREAGIAEEFTRFLADYGTHCVHLGEISEPTWLDDPTVVLRALNHPPVAPSLGDDHALTVLLAAVDVKARKTVQASLDALRVLLPLQSNALHALSGILAGTRRWALGAAKEGMLDNRLTGINDIYLFELEEIKQMMTGEWNISSLREIHATAAKRSGQARLWRGSAQTDLYIGDTPAQLLDRMEPSVILEPSLFFSAAIRTRNSAIESI